MNKGEHQDDGDQGKSHQHWGAMLRETKEEQQMGENLILDLQLQGSKPKTATSTNKYKIWHSTLMEPHMVLMVEGRDLFVQGVHSVLTYETSRRRKDQYTGKHLVAVGE